MLKFKIEKLEDVPEAVRGLYKQVEGGFELAVEGIDPREELVSARNHERDARKAAEAKLKEITDAQQKREAEQQAAIDEANRKAGNVQALEKSWQEKMDKALADQRAKYEPEVGSLTADVNRLLVDNVATQIARKIAVQGSDQLLIPHIRQRLAVDIREGQRTTVVVDAQGKPSALTLDDLEKEFVGNKAFAPVIVGTKASGGGAGGAGGGGAAGGKSITRAAFEALNPQQRVEAMKVGTTVTD